MRVEDNRKMQMRCPHCKHTLTLKEAIVILNGSGFKQFAKVRLHDGRKALVEAGLVNPTEVEIIEDANGRNGEETT